jgi:hypothetical protein
MKCKICSKSISEESQFCEHCGAKQSTIGLRDEYSSINEIFNHLEFLGYEVHEQENTENKFQALAKHKTKSNILFTFSPNIGFSFVSYFNLDQGKVKKKLDELFTRINTMNNKSILIAFSIVPALDSIVCGSWYPSEYSKKTFSEFIELYEIDIKARLDDSKIIDFS